MTILSKLQEGVSVCTEQETGKRERAEAQRVQNGGEELGKPQGRPPVRPPVSGASLG